MVAVFDFRGLCYTSWRLFFNPLEVGLYIIQKRRPTPFFWVKMVAIVDFQGISSSWLNQTIWKKMRKSKWIMSPEVNIIKYLSCHHLVFHRSHLINHISPKNQLGPSKKKRVNDSLGGSVWISNPFVFRPLLRQNPSTDIPIYWIGLQGSSNNGVWNKPQKQLGSSSSPKNNPTNQTFGHCDELAFWRLDSWVTLDEWPPFLSSYGRNGKENPWSFNGNLKVPPQSHHRPKKYGRSWRGVAFGGHP